MSPSTTASMLALRDADPVADRDLTALVPDWDVLQAQLLDDEADDADRAPRSSRRPVVRVPRRRWRLAVAGLAVAAAIVVAGVVAWPWSGSGPAAVAYGVTKQSDGTVAVRLSTTQPLTPADLQARLRAAGVPAVVLEVSAPGTCATPYPNNGEPAGRIISFPSNISRTEGFVVNPTAIPSGDFLFVALPSAAERAAFANGGPAYAALSITADPPACVAPQDGVPIASGGPTPSTSTSTR